MGLTAAIFLAQEGYDVDVSAKLPVLCDLEPLTGLAWPLETVSCCGQVFEKREDPREQQKGAQPPKTIFYGLSGRGKSALIAVSCIWCPHL